MHGGVQHEGLEVLALRGDVGGPQRGPEALLRGLRGPDHRGDGGLVPPQQGKNYVENTKLILFFKFF